MEDQLMLDPREIIAETYSDLKMEEVMDNYELDDVYEAAIRDLSRCEAEWLEEPEGEHALCDDPDCEMCYNEDGECIHPLACPENDYTNNGWEDEDED